MLHCARVEIVRHAGQTGTRRDRTQGSAGQANNRCATGAKCAGIHGTAEDIYYPHAVFLVLYGVCMALQAAVKDYNGDAMTVYSDRVDEAIHEVFSTIAGQKIAQDPDALEEFIRKATQNMWAGAMMRVCRLVFANRDALRMPPYDVAPHGGMANNNAYNPDTINAIADIYIYYCGLYDKIVNLHGFSKFCGVDTDTLYKWGADDPAGAVSSKRVAVFKKLSCENERSLADRVGTGKVNPVGVLAVLNHHHGWNMPGVSREIGRRTARALDQLPQFGNVHNALADGSRAQDVQDAAETA